MIFVHMPHKINGFGTWSNSRSQTKDNQGEFFQIQEAGDPPLFRSTWSTTSLSHPNSLSGVRAQPLQLVLAAMNVLRYETGMWPSQCRHWLEHQPASRWVLCVILSEEHMCGLQVSSPACTGASNHGCLSLTVMFSFLSSLLHPSLPLSLKNQRRQYLYMRISKTNKQTKVLCMNFAI